MGRATPGHERQRDREADPHVPARDRRAWLQPGSERTQGPRRRTRPGARPPPALPPPAAVSHLEHRLLVLAVLNLGRGQVEHEPLHGIPVAVVHVGVGPPHHHEALGPAGRVRLQEVQVPLLGDDRAGGGDAPKPSFCSCPPAAQPPPGTGPGSGSGSPSCPLCLLILHPCPRSGGPARPPGTELSPFQVRGSPPVLAGAELAGRCFRRAPVWGRAPTHLTRISWMSGTSWRWGSLLVSVARAGEGGFLESTSGRGSGSGLAGREQGCGVLGKQSEAAALLPGGASLAQLPRQPVLPPQNRRGRLPGPAPHAGSDLRPARHCAALRCTVWRAGSTPTRHLLPWHVLAPHLHPP